jgi:phenylpropionate dioxygenase-like ring-hydroxylating dioxygenase large terminal subunit
MIADVMVRNAWYAAGLSNEFPKGKLAGQVIAEKPIVLWRAEDGRIAAFDDRCCHKRMPLSAGRFIEPDLLECAYHGLCYDKAGQCVRVPSHSDGRIPPGARLRPLPVIEQDGLVWLWPGDPAKADAVQPPRIPEMGDPTWDTLDVAGPMHVPANYMLLIENLLDITHFYPLHDGNIGDVENSRIPIEVEEGTGAEGNHFVGTVRKVSAYRQPPYLAEYFGYDVVDRHHTHFMLSPGVTRVEMRVWPEGRMGDPQVERGYVIVHTHTPIDRRNHVWHLIISMPQGLRCKSDPAKRSIDRFVETFPGVIEQDRWALEKQQRMFDYPDDGYREVFLKPDTALRRARLILTRLERAETETAAGPDEAGIKSRRRRNREAEAPPAAAG